MKKPSEYVHDVDADYPDGRFKDETALDAGDGTNVEAAIFTDVYYALINVIKASGIIWTGANIETDIAASSKVSDFLDALTAYNRLPAGNPFANYALFRDEKGSGAAAQALSPAVFSKRNLIEKVNSITGASIASDVISLPAGTYYAKGWGLVATYSDNGSVIAKSGIFLGDSGAAADRLIVGSSEHMNTDVNANSTVRSDVEGRFTLATPGSITLRQYTSLSATGGYPASIAGFEEVYAALEIWKLD